MAEYIEREKVFELIREQKEKETGAYSRGKNKGLMIAGSIVNNKEILPTADVVEVVRCKDCKWYQEGEFFAPNKYCFRLEHPKEDRKIGYNYAPDDFCSYGVRRSDTV